MKKEKSQIPQDTFTEELQRFFEDVEKAPPEVAEGLNAELFGKDRESQMQQLARELSAGQPPRKPEYNPEDPAFDLSGYLEHTAALNAIANAYLDAKEPKRINIPMPEYDPELDPNNPAANPDKIREALEKGTSPELRKKMQGAVDALAEIAKKTNFLDFAQREILSNGKKETADHLRELIDAGIDSTDFLLRVYKSVLLHMAELPPEELEIVKEEIAAAQAEDIDENQITFFDEPTGKKRTRRTPKLDALAAEAFKEVKEVILQNNTTNALTKFTSNEKDITIDPITGEAQIIRGNFILKIPHYEQLTGLKTSTWQLLDLLTMKLTDNPRKAQEPTVKITLDEYMQRRGLKDRKAAKEQAIADLEIIKSASFTLEELSGKGKKNGRVSYRFINLADSGSVERNGDIILTFGATFHKSLASAPVMFYPPQLQKINNRRYPNAYYLGRKIAEFKNINALHSNEGNIISVKTLLENAPFIPSVDEVASQNRNFTDRIIEPFERDMSALQEVFSWEYCHANGEPLTDEELKDFTFDTFLSCNVKISWQDYPDQTKRREALEAKKAKYAEAKRKRGRPKTKPDA